MSVYILKQFQKKRLGKQLYDKALEVARRLSRERIWLGVWEKNSNAIAFYEQLGFNKIDQHSFYMGDEQQIDYIMMKSI